MPGEALRGEPDALLLRRALARHVIGRDDLDRAVRDRRPQRVQVVAGLERRVRLADRADVHVERVRQVVRAGLEVDLRVARAPALRLLDRQARGHVRDVDPRAELLREVGGADEVLRLGDRRLRQAPVAQRVPPLLLEPAPDAVDELDVLGVADGDDVAEPRRRLEEIVEVAVVGAVEPEIAPLLALEVHEVLERGDAELRDVARRAPRGAARSRSRNGSRSRRGTARARSPSRARTPRRRPRCSGSSRGWSRTRPAPRTPSRSCTR